MKNYFVIVASVLCGVAVSYVFTSMHHASRLRELERSRESEIAAMAGKLHKDLKRAKREVDRVEVVETVVPNSFEVKPEKVLKKLVAIKIDNRDRNSNLREVIFHLETLTNLGPKSIPVLRDYISSGEDVSYNYSRYTSAASNSTRDLQRALNARLKPAPALLVDGNFAAKTRAALMQFQKQNKLSATGALDAATRKALGLSGNQQNENSGNARVVYLNGVSRGYTYYASSYGNPSSGYLVPPSLRSGLFQVAADIGGQEAELLLVDTLGMSQKGGEVAFLDSLLQKIAPDRYAELVLKVAKNLLMNPANESLNDYQHKSHLYSILTRHRDIDFSQNAQSLLIGPTGKLDRYALNYLNSVLKADAVPLLALAAEDERLNNEYERQSIITYIMRYTGQHPQADQLFLEIMRKPLDSSKNSPYYRSPQYTALNSLSYNADEETALKRKVLLESVRDSIVDGNLKRAADAASKRLEYRISPKSNPWKKQGGGFPKSGTLPTSVMERLAL